jgi:hypothetical protein
MEGKKVLMFDTNCLYMKRKQEAEIVACETVLLAVVIIYKYKTLAKICGLTGSSHWTNG